MTTTLTVEQKALYTTRLTEAEGALHTLRLGGQARVVVDQNGERVEFSVANRGELRAYVMELRQMLGLPTGVVGPLNAWMM